MDEILAVLAQLLLEFLGEIALQLLAEVFTGSIAKRRSTAVTNNRLGLALALRCLTGAVLGWLACLVVDHSLITAPWARHAYLALGPLVAGVVGLVPITIGQPGDLGTKTRRFWLGVAFGGSFIAVRFLILRS